MIRYLLPFIVILALAAQSSAFVLTETHGSTWVTWEWNVSTLNPGQALIARYDGVEVVNQTPDSPPPLVQVYSRTGIGPNEPHSFEVILLDTDPVAVNETQVSRITTAQGEGYAQLFLVLSLVIALVAFVGIKANKFLGIFLWIVAFVMAGEVFISTGGTNTILSLFGALLAALDLLGLAYTFHDKVTEETGWGS